jgi:hypothetical protein
MSKSSKIIVAARVTDVFKLLLAGAEIHDIERYGRENGWDVGPRQLQRYIKFAYQRFAKAACRNQQQVRGRLLMQLRHFPS